jgi:hypothetical protein
MDLLGTNTVRNDHLQQHSQPNASRETAPSVIVISQGQENLTITPGSQQASSAAAARQTNLQRLFRDRQGMDARFKRLNEFEVKSVADLKGVPAAWCETGPSPSSEMPPPLFRMEKRRRTASRASDSVPSRPDAPAEGEKSPWQDFENGNFTFSFDRLWDVCGTHIRTSGKAALERRLRAYRGTLGNTIHMLVENGHLQQAKKIAIAAGKDLEKRAAIFKDIPKERFRLETDIAPHHAMSLQKLFPRNRSSLARLKVLDKELKVLTSPDLAPSKKIAIVIRQIIDICKASTRTEEMSYLRCAIEDAAVDLWCKDKLSDAFRVIEQAIEYLADLKTAQPDESDLTYLIGSDCSPLYVEILELYIKDSADSAVRRTKHELLDLQEEIAVYRHNHADEFDEEQEDFDADSQIPDHSDTKPQDARKPVPGRLNVHYLPGVPIHDSHQKKIAEGYEVRVPNLNPSNKEPVSILAFSLPGVDGENYFREAQVGTRCGAHALNNLNALLTGNRLELLVDTKTIADQIRHRLLTSGGVFSNEEELETKVARESTYIAVTDLVAHNNSHLHVGYPRLEASKAVYKAGTPHLSRFVDTITLEPRSDSEQKINHAPAVGITFNFKDEGDKPAPHTVVVMRDAHGAFFLNDSRRPTLVSLAQSHDMCGAIAEVCGELGFLREGEVDVFYPVAASH